MKPIWSNPEPEPTPEQLAAWADGELDPEEAVAYINLGFALTMFVFAERFPPRPAPPMEEPDA